jgi:hypothetical protein
MGQRPEKQVLHAVLVLLGGVVGGLGAFSCSVSRADPVAVRQERVAGGGDVIPAGKSVSLVPVSRVLCPPTPDDLTEPLTTSALDGASKFVAHDQFREDVSARSDVRISWLGAGFGRKYLAKVEPAVEATSLQVFRLKRPLRSVAIAGALPSRYETRLADIWCLLKLQPSGQPGVLSVDATPNLFFVRDAAGILGVVDVLWSGIGWEIGASPITRNRPWSAGRQVIAR